MSFRFGGQNFERSLGTKDSVSAHRHEHRIDKSLGLVESGRIKLPEQTAKADFLLSDGKLDAKSKAAVSIRLKNLCDIHFGDIPSDSLEQSSIKGMKRHQRQLERYVGSSLRVKTLCRDDLQKDAAMRSNGKGVRRRRPVEFSQVGSIELHHLES